MSSINEEAELREFDIQSDTSKAKMTEKGNGRAN